MSPTEPDEPQKEGGKAADVIIRSQYDRLLEGKKRQKNTLRKKLHEASSLGEIEFVVQRRKEVVGNRH